MDADKIVLFEDGRIKEQGTFTQLMERRGRFYLFFEKEFGKFKFFAERLSLEMVRVKRYKAPLSLAMYEVKGLGELAGKIGEERVNDLLVEVEDAIYKNIRTVDFTTKYQKDRFLVAMPETDRDGAVVAVRRIKGILSKYIFLGSKEKIEIVLVSGIADVNDDTNTVELLYLDAEKMLEKDLL